MWKSREESAWPMDKVRWIPYFLTLFIGIFLGGILINQAYKKDIYQTVKNYFSGGRPIQAEQRIQKTEPVLEKVALNLPTQKTVDDSRQNAIVNATRLASPSVVSLSVIQMRKINNPLSIFDDPFFSQFFFEFGGAYEKVQSMGSGFIINENGYILTNDHVVENASEIIVTLPDRRQFEGSLVGRQSAGDLAVVKIKGTHLPVTQMGNSDNLVAGEWVIAIGNPFGHVLDDPQPTVTVGVVSALNRQVRGGNGRIYTEMIQTDAAINMGNSGGPLINSQGEVVGINTVILSQSGGSIGLGFAIPINRAKRVIEDILNYGRIRGFWTGISIQNINYLIAQYLGLKESRGAIVVNIEPSSPGALAGLKIGDVLLKINSQTIENTQNVREAFANARVGDKIKMEYFRSNRVYQTQMVLLEDPNERRY